MVVAAGNGGEDCGGINTPPSIYDASTTVGATDNFDVLTNFSLRGPVEVDGSNRLKPDLVAPGNAIRSSIPGGLYDDADGTSLAAPHVTGLAALLISAAPCLRGDVDAQEATMIAAAVPIGSSEGCGGTGPDDVPNPSYGWGAIRAVVPSTSCGLLFSDGFESGDTSAWSATVP